MGAGDSLCDGREGRIGFAIATAYLVLTLAVGATAGADVLSHIQVIGGSLDAIVDQVSTSLYAGVVTVLAKRALKLVKG